MIKCYPFKLEDIEGFVPRWEMPNFEENMRYNVEDSSREMVSMVDSYGRLIAIIGANMRFPKVAEVWIVPSKLVDKHKFEFYKCIRSLAYEIDYNCNDTVMFGCNVTEVASRQVSSSLIGLLLSLLNM